jgi:hypothetical protein
MLRASMSLAVLANRFELLMTEVAAGLEMLCSPGSDLSQN